MTGVRTNLLCHHVSLPPSLLPAAGDWPMRFGMAGWALPVRTLQTCRQRKFWNETGNADQRRAAGRMPHRDR